VEVHDLGGVVDAAGDGAVGMAGRGVARRVVVDQHKAPGRTEDDRTQHLTRLTHALIQTAHADEMPADGFQSGVEQHDDDVLLVRQLQAGTGGDVRVPVGQRLRRGVDLHDGVRLPQREHLELAEVVFGFAFGHDDKKMNTAADARQFSGPLQRCFSSVVLRKGLEERLGDGRLGDGEIRGTA